MNATESPRNCGFGLAGVRDPGHLPQPHRRAEGRRGWLPCGKLLCGWRRLVGLAVFPGIAHAAPYLFDCGTAQSGVWPGFTQVTPATLSTGPATAGWTSSAGLTAKAYVYGGMVENRSRGTAEPPPIWTNAITEDAILGSVRNTFLIPAAPGDYEVYIVCGTSDPAQRSQYFDFTVQADAQSERVQIEGSHRFRVVRLRARVGNAPLTLTFTPHSKWVVNAILA